MVENSEVKLWGYKSAGPAQLRQLWKIQHVERDYYSIRSAYRHGLALRESGGDVLVAPLDTALAPKNTPLNFRWRIFRSGSSYVFQYVGTSSLTLRPADGATSPGADVTVTNVNPVDQFKWSLTWKTVQDQILLINTQNGLPATNAVRYTTPGESLTLAEMKFTASFVSRTTNNQSIKWVSMNPDIATVNESSGKVTAVSGGEVAVTANVNYQDVTYSVAYTVHVAGIPEGSYFIRNKSTNKYVDIYNKSMLNGTTIYQRGFDGDDSQRWVFAHLGDGTYSIKSVNSAGSYYLGVSGDATSNDQPVVLRTGSLTNGMKWKVTATADGAYKIMAVTGESAGCVLALESNGNALVQQTYVSDGDYRDEWLLCMNMDYSFMFMGETLGDPQMPDILEAVTDSFQSQGMCGYGSTGMTKVELLERLASSRIFACITHGDVTMITVSDGVLTVDDINALSSDAFKNLEFVYLGACLTGSGWAGANNLVNALHDKGADTVLGFTVKVLINEANYWSEVFLKRIAVGCTVHSAAIDADSKMMTNSEFIYIPNQNGEFSVDENRRYIAGDRYIAPCD